jgi:hypothetical protein
MVLENALCKRIPLLTDVPTIVFGADVTHPSPGEDVSPSIAAVCLSCSTCHNLTMLQSLYLEQKIVRYTNEYWSSCVYIEILFIFPFYGDVQRWTCFVFLISNV